MRIFRPKTRTARTRRGVAATELAVCAPVIVLVVIATIEATTMVFLQQSLAIAAYEATRVALVPNAESGHVQTQASLLLSSRGVKQGRATISPASISSAPAGSWIQVRVSAPFKPNSFVGGWLFSQRELSATVAMMKER